MRLVLHHRVCGVHAEHPLRKAHPNIPRRRDAVLIPFVGAWVDLIAVRISNGATELRRKCDVMGRLAKRGSPRWCTVPWIVARSAAPAS